MLPQRIVRLLAILTFAEAAVPSHGSPVETIHRDVCIIGGGSSGTHAAIRLQQMGKKVALIEKEGRLGGHVNTYVDRATGKTVDYGVVVFSNVTAVTEYFGHFDIPLTKLTGGTGTTTTVNFKTGKAASGGPLYGDAVTDALKRYDEQLAKYPGLDLAWDIPYPVPSDLLLNFGDFLRKYDLDVLSTLAFSYNQGAGNVLAQPTLFMMKYFDREQVKNTLTGFIANALDNNQLLYDRALGELGSDAFLSSKVTGVQRKADHVDVHVTTPQGPKLIRARKLLISIEPKLSALQQFMDLNQNEKQLFGQFNNSYYYDAMIRNTGIPDNTTLRNTDPDAAFSIPALPALYSLGASTVVPGVHPAYYGSDRYMSDADVKANIIATIKKARKGLGYPAPKGDPEFLEFHNHSPFELTVSKEAVENGFYRKLQALQGQRNTFYTGAAWNLQASSTIWEYNNQLILPRLMQ